MNAKGFVLLTLILVIHVLALLIFAEMRGVQGYLKMYHHIQQVHEARIQMMSVAETILKKIQNNPHQPCMMSEDKPGLIKKYLHEGGCVQGSDYHYAIADVGIYPCMGYFDSKTGTHHWLFNLLDREYNRLLQIRFVTPAPSAVQCPSDRTILQKTSLAWYES